jgi:hypothetical protein
MFQRVAENMTRFSGGVTDWAVSDIVVQCNEHGFWEIAAIIGSPQVADELIHRHFGRLALSSRACSTVSEVRAERRERERREMGDRQRERERQTEKQRERETDRDRERERDRERDREYESMIALW